MPKGFHQEYGIDYNEAFSLVVKQATIRVVLALAVHFHRHLINRMLPMLFFMGFLEKTSV